MPQHAQTLLVGRLTPGAHSALLKCTNNRRINLLVSIRDQKTGTLEAHQKAAAFVHWTCRYIASVCGGSIYLSWPITTDEVLFFLLTEYD